MSHTTDWFLADTSDAAELACAPPEELAEEYRHLSLRGVLETEVSALAKLLLGASYEYRPNLLYPPGLEEERASVTSEVFDTGAFVTHVSEDLVAALASIDDEGLAPIAEAWRIRSEHLRDRSSESVGAMLEDMRDFAALAVRSKKAVLDVFET